MSAARCVSAVAVTVLLVSSLVIGPASAWNFNRQKLRNYFKCPACDPMACPVDQGYPGCELVLEPGVCACCQVCAREAGELCGLTSGRCGKNLSCRPLPGDPDPLGAILSGTAVCM